MNGFKTVKLNQNGRKLITQLFVMVGVKKTVLNFGIYKIVGEIIGVKMDILEC
jgi:hypothetical protein